MVKDAKQAGTISKDQLRHTCEDLLAEAPAVLKSRDRGDPKMDKQSALLRALYLRLQQRLGVPQSREPVRTDFPTYAFAYRTALYELINDHAKEPFEYRPLVEDFLKRALKK